jgi:hypothetical protein
MDKYGSQIDALLDEARAAAQPGPNDRARIHRSFSDKLARRGLNAPAPPLPEGTRMPGAAAAAKTAALGGRVTLALLTSALAAGAITYGALLPRAESPTAASPVVMPSPQTILPTARPSVVVVPAAPSVEERSLDREPDEVAAAPASHSVRRATRKPSPVAPAAVGRSPGLAEEIALIAAARSELEAGNARAALADLGVHAKRFARGALRDERLGLRVLALCKLGRTAEAAAARERFLRNASDSVLAGQVRAACSWAVERPSP